MELDTQQQVKKMAKLCPFSAEHQVSHNIKGSHFVVEDMLLKKFAFESVIMCEYLTPSINTEVSLVRSTGRPIHHPVSHQDRDISTNWTTEQHTRLLCSCTHTHKHTQVHADGHDTSITTITGIERVLEY